MIKVSMLVNGKEASGRIDPRMLLVEFLREQLGLTGTHVGCDTSQCGACVVHIDGEAVKSCTTLTAMADGRNVTTIEGLAAEGAPLHPMQEAFRRESRPAMRLLHAGHGDDGHRYRAPQGPRPREHVIREELEGNLCRCTGYQNIVKSIAAGAKAMAR